MMQQRVIEFANEPSKVGISNAWAVVLRHYQKESGSDAELIPVLAEKGEKEKEAKKA